MLNIHSRTCLTGIKCGTANFHSNERGSSWNILCHQGQWVKGLDYRTKYYKEVSKSSQIRLWTWSERQQNEAERKGSSLNRLKSLRLMWLIVLYCIINVYIAGRATKRCSRQWHGTKDNIVNDIMLRSVQWFCINQFCAFHKLIEPVVNGAIVMVIV